MRTIVLLLFLFFGTTLVAQNELLAKNYFDKGDYEKAIVLYEKLYKETPYKTSYLSALVSSYQQLENFDAAQNLLEDKINARRVQPQFYVDLGYNFALQNRDTLAVSNYNRAIVSIDEKPYYASIIARSFERYSLLDLAVIAYEKGMKTNPELDFNIQLARLYGEQGNLELMFSRYIELMQSKPTYKGIAQRNFSLYVTEDPQNEANIMLRKTLLKKLQEHPDVLYNELLSWLFIQQKEFKKAFTQEKAIYKRTEEDLRGMTDLAIIAIAEQDYENATNTINFIIENAATPGAKLQAYQYLMNIKLKTSEEKDYPALEEEFEALIAAYGTGKTTYQLQIDYNHFLAFNAKKVNKAVANLKALTTENLNAFQEARVKMELADILVFDEKFNRALIYYSQIQNKIKSDVLAQEARYKVARTSYFKGDFVWAKAQVDVLRKSASQLIANDALQLALMIHDNSLEDSLQTALKKFARADLFALQNKNTEAISQLEDILTNHKGEKIEDEALLKQGALYEKTKQYLKAEVNYLKLIDLYKEDILADDAYYRLAKLYENELQDDLKAKELYEQIIFNFADSIYFVEARKRYRMLRGDAIE